MLPQHYTIKSHAEFLGAGQSGKSKLIQYCGERHLIKGRAGLSFIDGKGPLYDAMEAVLSAIDFERPVYLMDLSQPEAIIPFDPFAMPQGYDISEHVAECAALILKLWGAQRGDDLPTFSKIIKVPLTFSAITGEPLHHAAMLLHRSQSRLRDYALSVIADAQVRESLHMVCRAAAAQRDDGWIRLVESASNRLDRFCGSQAIKRFIGLPDRGLVISKAIRERAVILAKVKPVPGRLSEEAARVFAGFLFAGLAVAGLENAQKPIPHFCYADEAQEYATDSLASMLDLCLASGLRFTFIHHSPDQFADRPKLQASLAVNARIKFIFGGMPLHWQKYFAESSQLRQINELQVMDERTKYHVDYEISEDENGIAHALPYVEQETEYSYWSREEKIGQAAERYLLNPRHCRIELPDKSIAFKVPFVHDYTKLPSYENIVEFRKHHYAPFGAISPREADLKLQTQQTDFLERSTDAGRPERKSRAKAPTLHPQK